MLTVNFLSSFWNFFLDQVLGMHWLNSLVGTVLSSIGLDVGSRIGASLQFFIYDFVKISLLLSSLIFLVSYVQSYFPPERTKVMLGRLHGLYANLMGALLGTVTPFCSCSSIPLFIGFTNAGLPVGVTFSFLISSPLVDLGSFVMLLGTFGTKTAITYVLVGVLLAVIGGTIIDKLQMEDEIEQYIKSVPSVGVETPQLTVSDRLSYAKDQMLNTLKKVSPYVLVGVAIGAVIHNWIPQTWIETVLGNRNPFSVVVATLVGIPMYADIFGTIPIAEALHAKGVGIGTVLSFMMAVTALSLPSIVMLRKAVKPKLLGVFVLTVTVGIMVIGYTFNTVQGLIM